MGRNTRGPHNAVFSANKANYPQALFLHLLSLYCLLELLKTEGKWRRRNFIKQKETKKWKASERTKREGSLLLGTGYRRLL